MKNKTILIILILVFALVIGGASLLYNNWEDDLSPSNLTAFEEDAKEENTAPENKVEVETGDAEITEPSPDDNKETTNPQTPEKSEEPEKNEEDKAEADNRKENGEEIKNLAPDFTVYDKDEKAFKLSDFFGKPIVLNFWASWCGPCQSEMPDFEKKYSELGGDIHFLMINLTDGSRETFSSATEFISKKGYTFPVYYDKDIDAANKYRVYSIPTTYFIDKKGNLIAQASGAINALTLQKGIDMIK